MTLITSKHLQRVVDFAVRQGYTIKYSPKRRSATFKHRKKGLEIRTQVYWDKHDECVWVWFDFNGGMSGTDPDYEFLNTFKSMHLGDLY